MFNGRYAYLLSDLIFAGIPAILMMVFYYHLIKKHFRDMVKLITLFVFIAPFFEQTGFTMNTWQLSADRYLGYDIFGSSLETYLFTVLITVCISQALYIWTFYEVRGKNLFTEGLFDLINGTYAIWRPA